MLILPQNNAKVNQPMLDSALLVFVHSGGVKQFNSAFALVMNYVKLISRGR
jgi:hypothetical protein